ncbi:hypothetical protein [Foetidibacter luteolus]|uniref:hypothetical protein n=1 Tax=Foetidibacter luteolus TaxID=2608880 RepID=UPI00129BA876|nr:hypothetical protein [Foetidibacter luteolus]
MYKTVIALYLIVFSAYVLFTRQPDYFNGEQIQASIKKMADSTSGKAVNKAIFSVKKKEYAVNADYLFRSYQPNEAVMVIYEPAHPEKGAIYSWWGYWITWKELTASLVLFIVLFQVAVNITKNPAPEALIEELEAKPLRRRKYTG